MIKQVIIKGVASYIGEEKVIGDLTKYNFFFGSNGSGKTTISRLIKDRALYPTCDVIWENSIELEPMVYNRDFVKKTLQNPSGMPGVFTLGEDQVEIQEMIVTLSAKLDNLRKHKISIQASLGSTDDDTSLIGELHKIEERFKGVCWKQKIRHDKEFLKAFEGARADKEIFKKKLIEHIGNSCPSLGYEDLQKKYKTVFQESPVIEEEIQLFDISELSKISADQLIKKPIVGSSDIDISSFIHRLKASDWVREGYEKYYNPHEQTCPFCQQGIPDKIAKSLSDYFDETYNNDTDALQNLYDKYHRITQSLLHEINELQVNRSNRLQVEVLGLLHASIESTIQNNLMLLETKLDSPSRSITLVDLESYVGQINDMISQANNDIRDHNNIVRNLEKERSLLIDQIWKYIIEIEMEDHVKNYIRDKSRLKKEIHINEQEVTQIEYQIHMLEKELEEFKRKTLSAQPTIDAINNLLVGYGFSGFSLAISEDGNHYRILRPDKSPAQESLSEGETSFLTFLYFYYLITSKYGETSGLKSRVVVFDDPVSSLDNDVLIIVSSLIKQLIVMINTDDSIIKQLLLLTHNVYFYRQVTHLMNLSSHGKIAKGISYWIVRKDVENGSSIRKSEQNPVKCSYQLLWEEYKQCDSNAPVLPNVMRRILEFYFQLLGGISLKQISEKFTGREKQIYQALISWTHDGSHNVYDDAFYEITQDSIPVYKEVFRRIFINSGNQDHYDMMMGIQKEDSE